MLSAFLDRDLFGAERDRDVVNPAFVARPPGGALDSAGCRPSAMKVALLATVIGPQEPDVSLAVLRTPDLDELPGSGPGALATSIVVPREERDWALSNLGVVLTQARVIPSHDGDEIVGYKRPP